MYTDGMSGATSCPICTPYDPCGGDIRAAVTSDTWGILGNPPAMVYAPVQCFDHLYDLDTALRRGTLFEVLDLPFCGCTVKKGGTCRD